MRPLLQRNFAQAAVLIALLAGASAFGGSDGWTLSKALKQIDKANKKLYGVESEIRFQEYTGPRPLEGTGKLYIRVDGKARAEIAGDTERIYLLSRPYLYLYDGPTQTVTTYNIMTNPDRLGQYVTIGFFPSGSDLKKRFKVELRSETELDGHHVVLLHLSPKPNQLVDGVSLIRLYIDTTTWLPAQQEIVHRAGGTRIVLRYLDPQRVDQLPESLFKPIWPAGTRNAE